MRDRRPWIVLGGLLLLTATAYRGVRHCGFLQYDDDMFVTANHFVRQGLTIPAVAWAFRADLLYDSPQTDYWAPLTVLSRLVDVELFGLDPRGHHLTNLALHSANVGLLFLVLHAMTRALWRSAFVAAVLAVHPVHVESVAWVAERKDVLSGLFWLATIGAHAWYARAPGPARRAVVVAAFACGLMAKPMTVTLPFVLLLLDYWPLGRSADPSTLVREKWPLFLLSAGSVAVSVASTRGVSAGLESLSLAARLGNALVAYLGYLGQSFWPRGLGLGYPHAGSAPPAGRILLSVLILGLVSAAALRWRVRHPCLLVGWCWFLGVLVPTIGLVQVGVVARADRYLYLPLVGLSLATAWLAGSWALASRSRRLAVGAAGAAIVVALWSLTPRQVRYWADDVALFTRGVDAIADNVVARNGLGVALARRGDLVGAEAQFREALRIRPDLVLGVQNLALILSQTGRIEEAAALVERALETWARPGTLALPELTFTLARIRAGQGRAADAEALYARAAGLDRRHWAAFYNWGNLLAARGRFDEAAARYAEARSLNPDDPAIVNNLGLALLLQGRPGEAIGGLTEGVRQHPGSGLLRTSLGRALVAAGRREEGLAQLREGVHLAAGNPEAHLQLAQALADQGRTTEAAVHFREAARLDPAASPAPATRR